MMPYFAPEAHMPMSSCAPRLVATKAKLVIQSGTEWAEVRKSALVETFFRRSQPIPITKTK